MSMTMSDYPNSVAEVLDPPVRFKPATVAAVLRFKRLKPWRGSEQERIAKFKQLHADLCHAYGKATMLQIGVLDGGDSGSSYYRPATDTITLCGRLSVLTYLHEFAHALGRDEHGACRWSLNLFRQAFPISFARCLTDGHMLRRPDAAGQDGDQRTDLV